MACKARLSPCRYGPASPLHQFVSASPLLTAATPSSLPQLMGSGIAVMLAPAGAVVRDLLPLSKAGMFGLLPNSSAPSAAAPAAASDRSNTSNAAGSILGTQLFDEAVLVSGCFTQYAYELRCRALDVCVIGALPSCQELLMACTVRLWFSEQGLVDKMLAQGSMTPQVIGPYQSLTSPGVYLLATL